MPKLSVYVSDELWERAKRSGQDSKRKRNNSQVVQRALEQMVAEQQAKRSAVAAGAALDEARFAEVVAGLRDEATREYGRGYAAGLELAEALGLEGMQAVSNAGGLNLGGIEFISLYETEVPGDPVGKWWAAHGADMWRDPDRWDLRSDPFADGAEQAVADVWQALRKDAWGTRPADEPSDESSDEDGDGGDG
jgi:predicted transcriptional regulator